MNEMCCINVIRNCLSVFINYIMYETFVYSMFAEWLFTGRTLMLTSNVDHGVTTAENYLLHACGMTVQWRTLKL
jgi:hypothetical protein